MDFHHFLKRSIEKCLKKFITTEIGAKSQPQINQKKIIGLPSTI